MGDRDGVGLVGLFCLAAREIVDFDAETRIDGFVLHGGVCGGFGRVVAGFGGWEPEA
jgi:hypothetical protein